MIKNLPAALPLVFLLADPLSAQSLSGRVLDPQDAVVAEAELRLYSRADGSVRSARSGREGAYAFERLAQGDYLLEAEAARSALRGSVEIRIDSEDLNSDIRLDVAAQRTEVLVSASFAPQSVFETAKAVDAVDADEINRRDEFALGEAIRHLPGVRVQSQRGPGGLTAIRIRGMRNQDTSLLVDGMRFRDSAGLQGDATAFFQDMQIVDAGRVELLRGAGSSIYGSHAMAGAINIVTDSGGGRPHGEIRAEGGGLGFLRGKARLGGGALDERLLYSGGFSHLNVTEGVDGFDPYRNTSGHGFAKLALTPKASLSGRVWATDAFSALNESPTFDPAVTANHPASGPIPARALPGPETARFARGEPISAGNATFIPGFNDPDNHRTGAFLATAVVFEHRPTPVASWRLSYHGVDTNRSFRDGPAGRSAFDPVFSNESRIEGRTDTVQARADLRKGVHHATLGYELERESYFNRETDENPDALLRPNAVSDVDMASHAVFAQDQMRLFDGRLQLALSGRTQGFRLGDAFFTGPDNPYQGADVEAPRAAFTGDAAAAYFLRSTSTKLRAHVGNSYRAPSSFERFGGTFFFGAFSFWGDTRLNPERSASVDFGIDQWLARERVQLSATAFYTSLQETIVFDFGVIDPTTDPFGRGGGYRNAGGGLTRGVELSASVSPVRATTLSANYTHQNADSRTPTVAGTGFHKMLGVSDHLFNLTLLQRIGSRVDVTFDFFAASELSQQFFGAADRLVFAGPKKADISTGYRIPMSDRVDLRLYGQLENVFDQEYYEVGFQTPGRWGRAGLEVQF